MSTTPHALSPQRIDSAIYRLDGICDQATANVLSVFKGFRLVPIPIGASAMEVRSQAVALAAEAMSAEHHQRLAVSSIAVALGVSGLVAILFPQRDYLMAFLGRNPALGKTLITWHGRTFGIWIK